MFSTTFNTIKLSMFKGLLALYLFLILFSCSTNIEKAENFIVSNDYQNFKNIYESSSFDELQKNELIELILAEYTVNYKRFEKITIDKSKRDIINMLIASIENPNITLKDGTNILFWAYRHEDKEIFNTLINHRNINLDIIDEHENNLSFIHLSNLDDQTFDTFINGGLNYCNESFSNLINQDHPLYHILYKTPFDKCIKVLNTLNKKDIQNLKWNPMYELFHRYDNQNLKNEIAFNTEIYLKLKSLGVGYNSFREDGGTLLHSAVETGDLLIIKDLLDNGIDVNAKLFGEYTAFFYAVKRFGAGPGRSANPILKDIEQLFSEYGHVPINY